MALAGVLCLSGGGCEGEQRLWQVAGQVQQAVGRLCEGRGQSLGLLLQDGQREGGAVGQSVSRQRRRGVRTHLIQSQSGLLTVEGVCGRRRAQTCTGHKISLYCRLFCPPRLHLFDYKYSNISNIVKYYYYLK